MNLDQRALVRGDLSTSVLKQPSSPACRTLLRHCGSQWWSWYSSCRHRSGHPIARSCPTTTASCSGSLTCCLPKVACLEPLGSVLSGSSRYVVWCCWWVHHFTLSTH